MQPVTKHRLLKAGLLLMVAGASCAYERGYVTEKIVEQAIDEFHERVKTERYHDIYTNADPELRNRVSETELTAKLAEAHRQSGDSEHKAVVFVKDSLSRLLRHGFIRGRELISDADLASSETAISREKFV